MKYIIYFVGNLIKNSEMDNNYKIAKFMGAITYRAKEVNATKWNSPNFDPLHGKITFPYVMKFDTSWEWLMPVIKYIGTIELNYEPLSNVSIYSSIEEVYNSVIRFIDEYNKEQEAKKKKKLAELSELKKKLSELKKKLSDLGAQKET